MENKLTKEQIMALEKASEALFELASLALDNDDFNDFLSTGEIGKCWGKSIDEIALTLKIMK